MGKMGEVVKLLVQWAQDWQTAYWKLKCQQMDLGMLYFLSFFVYRESTCVYPPKNFIAKYINSKQNWIFLIMKNIFLIFHILQKIWKIFSWLITSICCWIHGYSNFSRTLMFNLKFVPFPIPLSSLKYFISLPGSVSYV